MTDHAAAGFFTLDEVNRLKIIQDVVDRRLTTQMAAQRLGISRPPVPTPSVALP
jgi:hypothetical protein